MPIDAQDGYQVVMASVDLIGLSIEKFEELSLAFRIWKKLELDDACLYAWNVFVDVIVIQLARVDKLCTKARTKEITLLGLEHWISSHHYIAKKKIT